MTATSLQSGDCLFYRNKPMRMMFRIKAVDETRGFTRYFWKAVPDYRADVN